ncbi:rap1 GTPase-GDP dissociation stimulator 1 isoform X1 [Sphaeramia orbicularis]|uniref:rap1 GTPase-GDP dissociation stimulator 1 isoform X1 n=1 Tax=Sphaeramia orbicularis TaxID=375764 RepID=UPI00117EF0CA|nr:rap1 GTPase-GDP dissociation stimulator 1-like isoform X1 [Sphaeramia orbicularis]XP_030012348.1 rap1 GTPase-GDP dissociation stimulator 1-like isoform X1 [Sphaeramia orbicularis]XP_030012349.1 rap1 GTPase-GDP dissociation stimulator 1-like isoform X1 [Sphaeramia orbicularis]XP_030012350.1 rap1 GTPase-GDP dissociation stimulator 1-like isoform X1 [Sphaeramia orbicularis]XP_030012352.1 rap1 GTPase-GDP dissociation stimulator 1-like isoform X1 [Sphaeramia orbicularis]
MTDADSLSEALKAISVSTELIEEELKPHLDTVLAALLEKKKDAAIEITRSGILPTLAQALREKGRLSCQVVLVIAEMARDAAVREPCIEAGLVKELVPYLNSSDQEMLLNTGRAIGRICFDNSYQQDQLVQSGVIPRLVSIMRTYPENDPLVNVCLLALCNLADIESAREALTEQDVADVLIFQLKRSPDAERRHVVLEILGSLGESDTLKLQFAESGVPEALSEMIRNLQGGSDPHDLCSIKIASNLIVSLLLGDESMQKCFGEGSGVVYQDVLSWLQSTNTQLQLSGALAIANFARNDSNCVKMLDLGVVPHILTLLEQHVVEGDVSVQHAGLSALRNLAIPATNKVRMLEDGVMERIKTLLRSDMPPVQFKLLGTLRMMVDGQEEAAMVLGRDATLLARVMEWCEAKDHAGVRGEASRLLAAVIRHSRSPEVVRAVAKADGVRHLISMATSEHVIMQNEALVGLAIASAIDIESMKDPIREAQLFPMLKKMLEDPTGAVEVKFSVLGLICSLSNSSTMKEELDSVNIKESLTKLTDHSSSKLAQQASSILTMLGESS